LINWKAACRQTGEKTQVRKKINFSEGDCFSIPLRDGGFARGVVTRMDGKGGIFGYFFSPRIEKFTDISITKDLYPEKAIFAGQFGDLGLINGEWKVIGQVSEWSRTKWTMPSFFLRMEKGDPKGFLSAYDEDTLKCIGEQEVQISEIDIQEFPEDGLMGYGFVEIRLTKILSE
jgi:immunity protein 26 of polymorphic toxin system